MSPFYLFGSFVERERVLLYVETYHPLLPHGELCTNEIKKVVTLSLFPLIQGEINRDISLSVSK